MFLELNQNTLEVNHDFDFDYAFTFNCELTVPGERIYSRLGR